MNGCNEVRFRTGSVQTMARVSYAWTVAAKDGGSRGVCEYDFKAAGKEYSGRGGDQIPIEYVASTPP